MIRNLVLLFVVVVAVVLALATYHLRSMSALPEQPAAYSYWEDTNGRATVQDVVRMGESIGATRRAHSNPCVNAGSILAILNQSTGSGCNW